MNEIAAKKSWDNQMQSQHHYQQIQQDDDEIDLGKLLTGLWEKKVLITFITLLGLLTALFFSFISTPIYQANALLQITHEEAVIPEFQNPAELEANATTATAEIEFIKSRQILGEAIDTLNLRIQAQPKYLPILGEAVVRKYPDSFWQDIDLPMLDFQQYAWNNEHIDVSQFNIENLSQAIDWQIIKKDDTHYQLFDNNGLSILEGSIGELSQQHHQEYGEITLKVDALVGPTQSTYILSKLSLIDTIGKIRNALSISEKGKKKETGIIELSIKHQDPILAAAILDSIAYAYTTVSSEQKSSESGKVLEFIEAKLPELKAKLSAAENALNKYREENNAINLNIENQAVVDKIATLERQLSEHQIEYAELEQKFADSHPRVLSLNGKIKQIKSRIADFNQQLKELPKTEQAFIRLTRDVEVNKQLYLTLLSKAQELRLVRAGDQENVRIIDSAMASNKPISPKKNIILALGTLLGLFTGIALSFILRARKGLTDPKEIELRAGYSVFATIPVSKAQNNLKQGKRSIGQQRRENNLLARQDPNDSSIEALRSFRTTLQFTQMDAENNIIAISGCAPDVGKSFVSANLALVLAETGKRVLLLDADLRKGTVHHYFKSTQAPGLSELITKEHDLSECLHSTDFNVDFVPSGSVPPNASTLLMHDNFAELLQQCSSLYDIVLVDTPPILAVTDPAIVSRLAGSLFLVLGSGRHKEREIADAVKKFEQNGSTITGFLLNRAEVQKEHRYRYGYDYYQKSYK